MKQNRELGNRPTQIQVNWLRQRSKGNTNGAGTTGQSYVKQKLSKMQTSYSTRINSKCILNLSIKWNTIKLLEDNTEENLDNLRFGDDL